MLSFQFKLSFISSLWINKRRFFYLFCLWLIYYYDSYRRTKNWIRVKRYKVRHKYLTRWIHKFNPDNIVYRSAISNLKMPKKITPENYLKLSESFIKVENTLLFGVSRQLIINVLTKMERMDNKIASKFLSDSPYTRARGKTMHTCELLELCRLLEIVLEKIQNDKTPEQNQNELVNGFIDLLPKEVQNFEENIEKVIAEMEKNSYERR